MSSYDLIKEVLVHKQEIYFGRLKAIEMGAYLHYEKDVILAHPTPTWKLKKKGTINISKQVSSLPVSCSLYSRQPHGILGS